MRRKFAQLIEIKEDRPITPETDAQFIQLLQTALLISLREQGYLNDIQLQHALSLTSSTGEIR